MSDLKPAQPAEGGKPRSSREDVLQFLDSLDSYSSPTKSTTPIPDTPTKKALSSSTATGAAPAPAVTNADEAQSVLDFLDELTQRSSTPTAPLAKTDSGLSKKTSYPGGLSGRTGGAAGTGSPSGTAARKSAESVRKSNLDASTPLASSTPPATSDSTTAAAAGGDGGWGWSSVWSQATNVVQQASQQASQVVQQARTVAEEQVKTAQTNAAGISGGIGGIGGGLMKALGENEQAKKWSAGVVEYARGAHLDQLGKDLRSTTLRSLTDLLNAVAPPIAEHEVIQVSLSHDMIGYDGVETLVYRGLTKIMESIEGGTLIVNKGNEEKPKEGATEDPDERNLNSVEGLEEGWKLAEANLTELIKHSFKPKTPEQIAQDSQNSLTVPVTTCPIYLRIQPVLAPFPYLPKPTDPSSPTTAAAPLLPPTPSTKEATQLFFILILRDPTHKLSHSSLSQSMPSSWLDIPFEENEWVEDVMVDVIRRSVETIGAEYIQTRMRAQSIAIAQAREAARQALDSQSASTSATPAPTESIQKATEEDVAEAAAASRVI